MRVAAVKNGLSLGMDLNYKRLLIEVLDRNYVNVVGG